MKVSGALLLPTKFPFVAYCLLPVFSCCLLKSWKSRGNLGGYPVFIKEEIHAQQIVVLSSSMKLDPGVQLKKDRLVGRTTRRNKDKQNMRNHGRGTQCWNKESFGNDRNWMRGCKQKIEAPTHVQQQRL